MTIKEPSLGLFLRNVSTCLLELLQIFTGLVTEHVLEGSLVKMVIDVVESVLSNVTNDQLGVLADLTTFVGSMSPIRGLTGVEFPEPLGPRTATREESET
jgi:hypothetical protein